MHKKSPRHLARSLALQGLYHHKLNQSSISDIEVFLNNDDNKMYEKANHELMHQLLNYGIANFDTMLDRYTSYSERDPKEINLVEKIILVIAASELLNSPNVPATVVINEAVELAKLYGAEDSYKFINGLVDKLANEVRHEELQHYKKHK